MLPYVSSKYVSKVTTKKSLVSNVFLPILLEIDLVVLIKSALYFPIICHWNKSKGSNDAHIPSFLVIGPCSDSRGNIGSMKNVQLHGRTDRQTNRKTDMTVDEQQVIRKSS